MSNIFEVFMDSFEFRLRDIMASRGVTHSQLADMMKIRQQNVSRWTTGKVSPTVETVVKLCRCLNCTPNDLIKLD